MRSSQWGAQGSEIYSVFSRDALPGLLLVEARSQAAVSSILMGLVGVFMSTPPKLVPIEEMDSMLRIKKDDEKYEEKQWVRMRRGKYAGDLAQIAATDQMNSGLLTVKLLPRIDLTPRESRSREKSGGKALGGSIRAPPRHFNPDEVRKIYGRQSVREVTSGGYEFDGEDFEQGFLFKDFKMAYIEAKDVKPTLEEVAQFAGDNGEADMDLLAIREANNSSTADYLPGDKVEVTKGEQAGFIGRIERVTKQVLLIRQDTDGTLGTSVEVSVDDVRKRFDVGEHVKVLRGKNKDASGMVVDVKGEVVTIMSDQVEQEVSTLSCIDCWSPNKLTLPDQSILEGCPQSSRCSWIGADPRDIRPARHGHARVSYYVLQVPSRLEPELMCSSSTAAVIVKVEGAMLRIMDQNGLVKVVSPSEVTARRDQKSFALATDSNGHDVKVGDAMKEALGEVSFFGHRSTPNDQWKTADVEESFRRSHQHLPLHLCLFV